MVPIVRIFGLTIQSAPLAVIVGFMLGLSLTGRVALAARRVSALDGKTLGSDALYNAGFYGGLVGVLGARLGYVLTNIEAYVRDPLAVLMPNTTALLPWAGWLIGLSFAVIYLWRRGALRPQLLDALAPGLAVFAIGLALAAFLNGDDFGIEVQLPWSVYLWGAWRHPVQLYELAALVMILVLLLLVGRHNLPTGASLLLFVALYACARVGVDGFRADAVVILGLRVTQLAGVTIASIALWLLSERLKHDLSPSASRP